MRVSTGVQPKTSPPGGEEESWEPSHTPPPPTRPPPLLSPPAPGPVAGPEVAQIGLHVECVCK